MTKLDLTIFIVFQVIVRSRPSKFCKILQVMKLEEVSPFAPKPQISRRESPCQSD